MCRRNVGERSIDNGISCFYKGGNPLLEWSWERACVLSRFSCVWLFVTLWTVALQAPLSLGFCGQEYWSGMSCPPPGDLSEPGIEPAPLMSPALAGGFFTSSATWEVDNNMKQSEESCPLSSASSWSPSSVPSWQEWAEFHSVAQLCLTLRPHGLQHARLPCSSPLPELAQTHVHWVSDAIQPSHPLSSPSPLAFSLSKHKGLFQGVSSSHQVAKVLEFQLQRQFFQWIFWKNIGWLRLTSLISLQSKGLSRISMVVLFQIALLSFFPCNYHMRKCEQVWEYLVSLGRMCESTDS